MWLCLFILGALVIGLPGTFSDRGEMCSDNLFNGLTTKVHSDADDNVERCCVDKKCHRGFSGVLCNEGDPNSSQCKECPPNKFNPSKSFTSDGIQCLDKQICDPRAGYKILSPGSRFEDRTCTCDETKGYFNRKRKTNPLYCNKRNCPAGQQLTVEGRCEDCPLNHFKKTNETHVCVVKTDCEKLGLQYKSYEYFSRIEDNECDNDTEIINGGKDEDGGEDIFQDPTEEGPTIDKSLDSSKIAVIIAGVLGIIVMVAVIILVLCKCRRKKPNDNQLQEVTYNKFNEEPLCVASKDEQRRGDEHDETSPLRPFNNEAKEYPLKRGPSETDERDFLDIKASMNGTSKGVVRQNTVDSGFCNGNSSGSERGSYEFQMESGPNTPSTSGLKAEPPIFPDDSNCQSLPVNINESVSPPSYARSNSGICFNCDKKTRQDSYPGTVHNSYHVYGSHSTVQICGGDCGQNTVNKSLETGPTCSSCAGTPEEEEPPLLETPEENSPEVIIERGPSDPSQRSNNEDNSLEGDINEVSMFRRNKARTEENTIA